PHIFHFPIYRQTIGYQSTRRSIIARIYGYVSQIGKGVSNVAFDVQLPEHLQAFLVQVARFDIITLTSCRMSEVDERVADAAPIVRLTVECQALLLHGSGSSVIPLAERKVRPQHRVRKPDALSLLSPVGTPGTFPATPVPRVCEPLQTRTAAAPKPTASPAPLRPAWRTNSMLLADWHALAQAGPARAPAGGPA